MEQESWLSNSADEPTSRSGPGLSDASILSSITLALASSDGHLVSRTGQLEGLVPHGEVLRTNSRLDAIRTDEVHEASSSTDGPASPVKRGRGRPKGSLDRNPRARKDSRAAGADNANISEENNAHSSATAGDTLDPQGNPIVKRKRGRPRKERTSEPTASREPNAGGTETVPAKAKSAGASHKPAVSYPITPERKEANRKAALRSRLRKVERATILEKMAAGLTEENVALKEKIQALNTLGFDEMAFQEETYPAAEVLRPTGYPGDPPSDVTLGLTPDTGQQKAETLSIAPARDTSDFAEHIRQERRIPSLRALLPSSANALQSDLERRLQDQIDRLRSALDSETEWSLPSASSSSKPKQDIVLLRDVAARLRGENKKATQVVRERRDELLLLNQNGQRTYQREEAETIVDGEAHRENALRQHSEVEAALADMKRHLGQLMTVSIEAGGIYTKTKLTLHTRL